MPITNIAVTGSRDADRRLRKFAKHLETLVPFWRELSEHLADEAQRRWPLKRRTGTLRTSLTWRGSGLGRGGVYEPTATRLTFGSDLFYGRFPQFGTKRQRTTPLIVVDEPDARARLVAWLTARAADAGLEVT